MNSKTENTIKEWKWSTGESYEKSKRKVYKKNDNYYEEELELYNNEIHEQGAIQQSLKDDADMSFFIPFYSKNNNENSNLREDLDSKLANRELVFQRGMNPFLDQTNYVDDVTASDKFLKPQNTSLDKVKFTDQ